MKHICMIALFISLTATGLFGQEEPNYLFQWGDYNIGVYASLGTRISELDNNAVGWLDARAAIVIDGAWAIGIQGSGLYHDKKLDDLVADGTYHLSSGYTGIFIERMFPLGDDIRFSLSITSGAGVARYQYDKEYQKAKVWKDEIIDEVTFAVFEPGFEFQYRVGGNWWIGVNGSIRNTSPLRMIGTADGLLRKASAGLTVRWGIF